MTRPRAQPSASQVLLRGINRRSLTLVEEGLRAGGDPDQRVVVEEQGHDPSAGPRARLKPGSVPPPVLEDVPLLTWAIRKANQAIVQRLIDAGADLNAVDTVRGRTPLHEAALTGKVSAVKALLAAGALIHARDREGASAFSWNHSKVRTVLMAQGFSLDTPGVNGWRPVHQAAHRGDVKRIAWCLAQGAAATLLTGDGSSVLHLAAERGDGPSLRLLLDAGVDPAWRDHQDRTAYDIAIWRGARATQAFDEAMAGHERRLLLDGMALPAAPGTGGPRARRRL